MKEVAAALRRMGLYYLLLALNIIPCANVIPDRFPFRTLSAVFLLLLSVCLVLYYAHRVLPTGSLSGMVKALSWMVLLLILLRGVKYSAFSEVDVLARHTWYLYYAPMLLLPLFLLCIALLVSSRAAPRVPRGWYAALALTLVLLGLILTNDLHQQAFRFRPDYADWDGAYSYGWLYYAATVWQYALWLAGLGLLAVKCRVSSAREHAWLLLLPIALGVGMNVLLLTDRMPRLNGVYIVQFPEALCCTAAAVLEGCMQLGLIPTNTDYGRLFRRLSICAQITDRAGNPVYASHSAVPLTAEQLALPDGARIGPHRVLHRMELPGGCGFWQDDLTELDRLNDALAEAKETLAQEAELIRLRNEWKEKQTKIEQRTLVYDAIARRTQRQSQAISRIAENARRTSDLARKEEARSRITLLGAYIKRYANLTLLAQERSVLEVGELGLSVSEVLRYLNRCGVPGELLITGEGAVLAPAALAAFEAFEALLEANLSCLRGVFCNLSVRERVRFKLTLEGLTEPLPEEQAERLGSAGVRWEGQREDDATYLCFTLPEGGAAP